MILHYHKELQYSIVEEGHYVRYCITINVERFAGLNFRGYQEYHKSFPLNT